MNMMQLKKMVTNWVVVNAVGSIKTMQFDIPPKGAEYAELMKAMEEDEPLEYDGTDYKILSINERRSMAGVVAEMDLDGLRATVFEEFKTGSVTLHEALTRALNGTGWGVVGTGLISGKKSMELHDVTPLDVVQHLMSDSSFGAVLDFDNQSKVISVQVPTESKVYLTRSLNLRELTYKGSRKEMVTRLYPYGKDGLSVKDINGGKAYIDNHSYSQKTIAQIWRDERYTDKTSLLNDAKKKLEELSKPEKSYECKVIDLASMDEKYSDLTLRLNAVVTLFDENRLQAEQLLDRPTSHTIVEIRTYPNEPVNNTIVLASRAKSTVQQRTVVSNLQKEVKAQTSAWEQAILNATRLITGQEGGYVVLNPPESPKEILIMDTPNINEAQKVWRWNSGGLGYSANGYNGPYTTAMTMNGEINADMIRTGELKSITITAENGTVGGWTLSGTELTSQNRKMKLNSNGTITVYRDKKPLMTLDSDGIDFWRNDTKIGSIGVTGNIDGSAYGLTFNLDEGDAMTWSVYDRQKQGYLNRLRFTEKDGLKVYGDIQCENVTVSGKMTCGSLTVGSKKVKPMTGQLSDGSTMLYWGW